jgi:hypothetical protein
MMPSTTGKLLTKEHKESGRDRDKPPESEKKF